MGSTTSARLWKGPYPDAKVQGVVEVSVHGEEHSTAQMSYGGHVAIIASSPCEGGWVVVANQDEAGQGLIAHLCMLAWK